MWSNEKTEAFRETCFDILNHLEVRRRRLPGWLFGAIMLCVGAAIGGAGMKLALQALTGQQIQSQDKTVKDSQGKDVQIKAIFLPTPEAYDNTTDAGKKKLAEIDVQGLNNLWPVSWYIKGWTDYTIDQMLTCKGPGE